MDQSKQIRENVKRLTKEISEKQEKMGRSFNQYDLKDIVNHVFDGIQILNVSDLKDSFKKIPTKFRNCFQDDYTPPLGNDYSDIRFDKLFIKQNKLNSLIYSIYEEEKGKRENKKREREEELEKTTNRTSKEKRGKN